MTGERDGNRGAGVTEAELQAVERVLDAAQDGGHEGDRLIQLADLGRPPNGRGEANLVKVGAPFDAMRSAGDDRRTGHARGSGHRRRAREEAPPIH